MGAVLFISVTAATIATAKAAFLRSELFPSPQMRRRRGCRRLSWPITWIQPKVANRHL